jgi:hypothetical protein
MAVFSFGLLLPLPQYIDLRFVPMPDIYNEPVSTDDLVIMGR